MTRGKNICNQLKEVRKRIAEENDIPLEIEECTYKGECRGTCPRCEAEVRYLENALADRLRLGKVATVAGLALGLAATAHAQTPAKTSHFDGCETQHELSMMADSVTVRGVVRDKKSGEDIPFCRIHLVDYKSGIDIDTAIDNGLRGDFALSIPKGEYYVWVYHFGYKEYGGRKMMIDKDTDLGAAMKFEDGIYQHTEFYDTHVPTPGFHTAHRHIHANEPVDRLAEKGDFLLTDSEVRDILALNAMPPI